MDKVYFVRILVVFVVIIVDTSFGIPTGTCVSSCPCKAKGRFYYTGERWSPAYDPCTVYECTNNGSQVIVTQDCRYKGECKAPDSEWTEGCSTFKCTVIDGQPMYKVVQTGCATNVSGSITCLAVGNRIQSGCDVTECQINGHLLEIVTIQRGCHVDGTCHSTGSHWHDGCTMYTCTNTGSGATVKVAKNVKMEWPEGQYSLWKPDSGCPSDAPDTWSEDAHVLSSSATNPYRYLNIDMLSGDFNGTTMRQEFCAHSDSPLTSFPVDTQYKTFWEPGSYCILKAASGCPRGFSNGSLTFPDTSGADTPSNGGFSTPSVGVGVCCRIDGAPQTEIVLPIESNFTLLLKNRDRVCQRVKGMESREVEMTFTRPPLVFGSGPVVYQPSQGQYTLTLCRYERLHCGCQDDSGEFIALHTEKRIDCVLKKCVEEVGHPVLQIVTGGCLVGGLCKSEDVIWTDFTGETCTKSVCKRTVNVTGVFFGIEELTTGCRDGELCKDVGTEIYRGCYTSSCVLDPLSSQPTFKVIRADCPWRESCMPPNSTWDHNCMSYRCDMRMNGGQFKWNVLPIKYGCNDGKGNCYDVGQRVTDQCYDAVCRMNDNKTIVYMDVIRGGCTWQDMCKPVDAEWTDDCHHFRCQWTTTETGFAATVNATKVSCSWNNVCYDDNTTWTDGCVTYQCEVNRATDEVNWSVKTLSLACRDFNNNCVPLGDSIVENCVTYTCKKTAERLRLEPIEVGCQWNNTCTPEDAVWTDTSRCVDYKCHRTQGISGTVMQVSLVNYGCVFNSTCKAVNATWEDGCRTRKCVVKKSNTTIQRSIAPITAGCDDQGICRQVGFKKMTDTCVEYECVFNETYKDAFFTLSSGACRSRAGECHHVGNRWEEKDGNMCLQYECQKSSIGYVSKMIHKKCLDANGQCHVVGASGFPSEVSGVLEPECRCEEAVDTVAIRCQKQKQAV